MNVKDCRVTPGMAKGWLAKNAANRPVRKQWVAVLSEVMKRGEFKRTHQCIAVNDDRLIDGQHRLMAFLESGLPYLDMMVAFDAPSNTFDAIDIGARRSLSDIYGIPREISEPVGLIAKLVHGTYFTAQQTAPLLELTKPHFERLRLLHTGNRNLAAAPVRVAAVARIFAGEDRAYVETLFYNLCKLNLDLLPPIASSLVRQSITGISTEKSRRMNDAYDRLARAFRVFVQSDADNRRLIITNGQVYIDEIREIFASRVGGAQ